MRRFLTSLILIALSCQQSGDPDYRLRSYASSDLSQVLWDNPRDIPVCFEEILPSVHYIEDDSSPNFVAVFRQFRLKLSEYITAEFKKADLELTGWGDCHSGSRGIRILAVSNGKPSTADFGKKIDGVYAGIVLPINQFKFNQQGEPIPEALSTWVHEFGHAIGLRHEANRRDNDLQAENNQCFNFNQTRGVGELSTIHLGDFDPDSIMNFCHINYILDNNLSIKDIGLSQGDIAAIKNLYHKPTVEFVSRDRFISDHQLELNVLGRNVSDYKFAFGAPSLDCKNAAVYSATKPINSSITINKGDVTGPFKVCAVGRNAQGQWQDLNAYTSETFQFVNAWLQDAPANFSVLNPSIENLIVTPTSSNGKNLRFKLLDLNSDFDCQSSSGYSKSLVPGTKFQIKIDRKFSDLGICLSEEFALGEAPKPTTYFYYTSSEIKLRHDLDQPISIAEFKVALKAPAPSINLYRFKHTDSQSKCMSPVGYSAPKSILTPITVYRADFNTDKSYLCLQAGHQTAWQALSSATIIPLKFAD